MHHFDDKLGRCFDLAEVKRKFCRDFRDSKEVRDIRERNAKVLQGIEPCRTFFRSLISLL